MLVAPTMAAAVPLNEVTLAIVGDTALESTMGGRLPLKVMASDPDGRPVSGVTIYFATDGTEDHGAMDRTGILTSLKGEAAVTWRVGALPGEQVARAWFRGGRDTVVWTATVPGPALLEPTTDLAFDGAYQGSATIAVLLTDPVGDPFNLGSVQFLPDADAGKVSLPMVRSNTRGEARVTWTFNPKKVGAQRVRVTAKGLPDTLEFIADVAGPPVATTFTTMVDSSLTGVVGKSQRLSVLVFDQRGDPMANAAVTFKALANSGSVLPTPATSGRTGVANATWTFGQKPGLQTVQVTVKGVPDTLRYVATVRPLPIATSVEALSDDVWIGRAGASVTAQVRVLDADGEPFPNAQVRWRVLSGRGAVKVSIVKADAKGVASTLWTFGGTLGLQELSAEIVNFPATAVVISAEVSVGEARAIVLRAGSGQSAAAGTEVAIPPQVRVTDNFGNPVEGVMVQFKVTQGGGAVDDALAISDMDGLAAVGAWRLGSVGPQRLQATALANIQRGNPLVFTATATKPPP